MHYLKLFAAIIFILTAGRVAVSSTMQETPKQAQQRAEKKLSLREQQKQNRLRMELSQKEAQGVDNAAQEFEAKLAERKKQSQMEKGGQDKPNVSPQPPAN